MGNSNIIIFTTKIIGKPENFFNKEIFPNVFDKNKKGTKIKEHALLDGNLLEPYNVEDIKEYIEKNFANLEEAEQKKIANKIINNNSNVQVYFNMYFKNKNFDHLFNIEEVKKGLISYFESEIEKEKVEKLKKQIGTDDFKSRNHIYGKEGKDGIEVKDIYAYRCLDLDYVDEVFTPQARYGFIDAIVTDIAEKIKGISLEKLIEENTIYLIIHEDDINFKKTTKELNIKEMVKFLFKYNPEIGKIITNEILGKSLSNLKTQIDSLNDSEENEYNEKLKDKFKCYVFQHTSGIFVDILNNNLDKVLPQSINNKIPSVDNLASEINKYFELRHEYKELESKAFMNPDMINDIKKEIHYKIRKKLGDNQKLF